MSFDWNTVDCIEDCTDCAFSLVLAVVEMSVAWSERDGIDD